jgi:hypothetical protein
MTEDFSLGGEPPVRKRLRFSNHDMDIIMDAVTDAVVPQFEGYSQGFDFGVGFGQQTQDVFEFLLQSEGVDQSFDSRLDEYFATASEEGEPKYFVFGTPDQDVEMTSSQQEDSDVLETSPAPPEKSEEPGEPAEQEEQEQYIEDEAAAASDEILRDLLSEWIRDAVRDAPDEIPDIDDFIDDVVTDAEKDFAEARLAITQVLRGEIRKILMSGIEGMVVYKD